MRLSFVQQFDLFTAHGQVFTSDLFYIYKGTVGVIYSISNMHTKDVYVGGTSTLPFGRWSQHIADLKMHRHGSRKLQVLWDEHPTLQAWEFRILESEVPADVLLSREQFWFDKLSPTLNGTTRISRMVSLSKTRQRVLAMLAAGENYRAISKETGCSLGTITNIKRKTERFF